MHIDDFRSSRFLAAKHLKKGKQYRVKVLSIHPEEMPNQKRPKPCAELQLNGRVLDKLWIINATNLDTMAEAYGPILDNWVGEEVILASERTNYQGKMVDGIRCQPIKRAAAKPAPQNIEEPGADIDEDNDLLDDPGVPGEEDQL